MKLPKKKYALLPIILIVLCFIGVVLGVLFIRQKPVSAEQYFVRYIDAYNNGDVICPPADSAQVKNILQQGFSHYQEKALQKNPSAGYLVGIAYLSGIGVDIDVDKGKNLLYEAAQQNYVPAQTSYGILLVFSQTSYHHLIKGPLLTNNLEGWALLKKAANDNNPIAELSLATYYMHEGEYTQGVALIEKWANRDNLVAQIILGGLYLHNFGVPRDYKKAIYWYKKAINHQPMSRAAGGPMMELQNLYSTPGPLEDKKQADYWQKRVEEFRKILRCES